MTTGLINGMLSGGAGATRPFLSNLVDAVGDSDNALLDELERLVRDKRERLKSKHAGDQGIDGDQPRDRSKVRPGRRRRRRGAMRLLLSSVLLGLVWFVAVNIVATLAAWTLGSSILAGGSVEREPLAARRRGHLLTTGCCLPSPQRCSCWRVPAGALALRACRLGRVLRRRARRLAAIGLSLVLRGAWRAGQARALPDHRFAALARRTGTLVEGDAPARSCSAVCPACRSPGSGGRGF